MICWPRSPCWPVIGRGTSTSKAKAILVSRHAIHAPSAAVCSGRGCWWLGVVSVQVWMALRFQVSPSSAARRLESPLALFRKTSLSCAVACCILLQCGMARWINQSCELDGNMCVPQRSAGNTNTSGYPSKLSLLAGHRRWPSLSLQTRQNWACVQTISV